MIDFLVYFGDKPSEFVESLTSNRNDKNEMSQKDVYLFRNMSCRRLAFDHGHKAYQLWHGSHSANVNNVNIQNSHSYVNASFAFIDLLFRYADKKLYCRTFLDKCLNFSFPCINIHANWANNIVTMKLKWFTFWLISITEL